MRALGVLFALLLLNPVFANWTIEVSTGTSQKLPNTIHLTQEGYPDTDIPAQWETRPFVPFTSLAGLTENYYGVRVGYRPKGFAVGYEVELLHDKAYYVGERSAIRHLEISDGYNIAFFNVTYTIPVDTRTEVVIRGGTGAVITNPTSEVRGETLGTRRHLNPDNHYYLSGIAFQLSLQGRYYITDWFGLGAEARYVRSWSDTPIFNGYATTQFNSVHLEAGVVFRIR